MSTVVPSWTEDESEDFDRAIILERFTKYAPNAADHATNARIVHAVAQGFTHEAVSARVGVSPQRVYQVVRRYRDMVRVCLPGLRSAAA